MAATRTGWEEVRKDLVKRCVAEVRDAQGDYRV